ncbi:hypothetical protein BDF20DRAFT_917834 [Mycotypha africana]|uniref:uncharacterized protein n=1 Tax=Mycotypha africana TaxID=64632 RepID=UPI00230154E8|nr:uncharacterized protein BDF20DRAFT_917834 [Mycotypha africana]KAI8967171.1 hypothetical protein BDF20DRAFT_917834 [Mycotypha africana]
MLIDKNDADSTFKLWSPPTFDWSTDSFSTDLFRELDKTRHDLFTNSNSIDGKEESLRLHQNDMAINNNMLRDSLQTSSIRTSSQLTATTTHTGASAEESVSVREVEADEKVEKEKEKKKEEEEEEEDGGKGAEKVEEISKAVHQQQQRLQQDSGVALEKNDNDAAKKEAFPPSSNAPVTAFMDNHDPTLESTALVEERALQYHSADEIGKIVSKQYPPKPLQYSPVNDLPSSTMTTAAETTHFNIRKSISLSRKKSNHHPSTAISPHPAAAKDTVTAHTAVDIGEKSSDTTSPLQRVITNHNNASPTIAMTTSSPFPAQESPAASANKKRKRRFFLSFLLCY